MATQNGKIKVAGGREQNGKVKQTSHSKGKKGRR